MRNKVIKFILFFVLLHVSVSYAVSLTGIDQKFYPNTDKQIIELTFDGVPPAQPKSFVNGNDLKIDLVNTVNNLKQNDISFKTGFIKNIGIMENQSKLRLSLADAINYSYFMSTESNRILITLIKNQNQGQLSAQEKGFVAQSSNNSNKLLDVNFKLDDTNGGVLTLTFNNNKINQVTDKRLANSLVVDIGNFILESGLAKNYDVSDFNSKINSFRLTQKQDGIKLTINNKDQWSYYLYQIDNKLIVSITPTLNNSTTADGSSKNSAIPMLNKTKTNLVSFNFQNIDIRALLQLLADFSGYNILISDQVSGTISIKLDNVPWDDALNIILDAKGLGMQRTANIIKIAPLSELMANSKQQLEKQKIQNSVEPLEMLTLHLKYTKVKDVQQMLQSPFGKDNDNNDNSLLSKRGSVIVDDRTNMMIINDMPSHLNQINDFINKIDIPVQQVMIEARIVEASSNFERSLGTQFFIAGLASQVGYANTLNNAVAVSQNGTSVIPSNTTIGSTANAFQNTTTSVTGSSFALVFSPGGNSLLGFELDANEAMNDGRTISNPKVITSNYKAANIQQGIQIPYQSSTSSGATSVSFVSATLSLQVTPQITDDGNVMLDVNVHKDTVNSSLQVQGTPSINTNSVTTNVLVEDGSTIMIGGIYVDTVTKVQQQIPILGDIPVLGWLFKSVQTKKSKQELLIFITPRIIRSTNTIDN